MKGFFGKIFGLLGAIWFVIGVMTGQKKVLALKREKPPVPLVVFRQSSRFLVLWPVIVMTWLMALAMWLHGQESSPEWLKGPEIVSKLGGWWATILIFAVLVWRVRMKFAITVAIVAVILVFYFWTDKLGQWVPFLEFVSRLEVVGNWGIYALIAAIASVDVFIVWLYARFHYFIATPNKGFLVWGWFASERPIEYSEYDLQINLEDVIERAFGFGSFRMRHKHDTNLNIEFPCVFGINRRMSKFNELTTELRVKAIDVDSEPEG